MQRSSLARAFRGNRVVLAATTGALAVAMASYLHTPTPQAEATELGGLTRAIANESDVKGKPRAAAAADYFLKIEAIEGESSDDKHSGEIQIESFSWGASNSSSAGAGAGTGSGKVSISSFNFTKRLDKSSPKLFLACATGQRITKATLVAVRSGAQRQEYLTIVLSDVLVSSYKNAGSDEAPTDSFSLNFQKIEYEYRPQAANGGLGSPSKATYDLKKATGA